jgi:indole-3-glycerol phosphate synthase
VIGINNRDLKAQKTDISKSLELIPYLPKNKLCISESGIKTVEELELLRKAGFGGALIGESILKSNQPGSFIESLNSGICS